MSNTPCYVTIAQELMSKGTDARMIKATLMMEGASDSAIKKVMSDLGVAKTVKKGFRAAFHAWLVEAERTEEEATAYVKGDGEYGETTPNVIKHLSVFLNEYRLAAAIREKLAVEVVEPKPKTKKPAKKDA